MKVLQINCVYGKGSTGKITADIHSELIKNGIESVVCYGRGMKTNEPHVYKTCGELYSKMNNFWSRVTGLMYGGCFLSTRALIRAIEREKPDVVHLQCLNGYFVNIYRLIEYLKRSGIPTVLTLHAEFMYTANCGHAYECNQWINGCVSCPRWKKETKSILMDRTAESWRRMKKAFDGFQGLMVVSVSEWLMERAKQSAILNGFEHQVIYNGVNTDVFRFYGAEKRSNLRSELGIADGKKVIIHVTPGFSMAPDHIKGGYYVMKAAEQMPEAVFVVVGAHEEMESIPENVIMLGEVRDQERLARLYSMADATLLASKKETFSMICAESLCCGTPVAGFEAGAPERISLKEYSVFTKYGDVDRLVDSLRTVSEMTEKGKVSAAAKEKYSRETMAERYLVIYCEQKAGE